MSLRGRIIPGSIEHMVSTLPTGVVSGDPTRPRKSIAESRGGVVPDGKRTIKADDAWIGHVVSVGPLSLISIQEGASVVHIGENFCYNSASEGVRDLIALRARLGFLFSSDDAAIK